MFMTNINQNDIKDLFSSASSDKNAVKQIFHTYKQSMYSEAMLYLDDDQKAKNAAVAAFRNAITDLKDADTDDPEAWLNQYVQNECCSEILPLETSNRNDYTDADEIESPTAVIPSSNSECRKRLVNTLKVLTPSQRLASILHFRDRLSIDEITQKLHSDEDTVKNALSDAKKTIKASNQNLSALIAIVNKLFPVEKEEPKLELEAIPRTVKTSPLEYTDTMNEDLEFTTSVLELKNFFNQQKTNNRHYSDHGIDEDEAKEETAESERPAVHEIEATQEIPVLEPTKPKNTNVIQSEVNYYDGNDDDENESHKIPQWLLYGLIFVLLVGLGFAGAYLISNISSNSNASKTTPVTDPIEENTPSTEENAETDNQSEEAPSDDISEETPTPEPDEPKTLGTAHIIVTDLNLRTGPGLTYALNGMAEYDAVYDVLTITEADGYTWYQISENQWVPDLADQYVTYTEN